MSKIVTYKKSPRGGDKSRSPQTFPNKFARQNANLVQKRMSNCAQGPEAESRAANCAQCGAHIVDTSVITKCAECGSDNFRGSVTY